MFDFGQVFSWQLVSGGFADGPQFHQWCHQRCYRLMLSLLSVDARWEGTFAGELPAGTRVPPEGARHRCDHSME